MACKAPHHHHACSGGGSSFGRYHRLPAASFLRHRVSPVAVGLLGSTPVDLDEPLPAPKGWERCLHLQTGRIFYRRAAMSRNNGKSPKLDLKLNLSLPTRGATSRRVAAEDDSPKGSSSSSPPSSCLSSCSNSPEAASMVLAGCPRCLMYVMLSEEDPKCPKCKSAVLLDFFHGSNTAAATTTNSNSKNNNNSKTRKS